MIEGRDSNNILPNGKQAKKVRITAVGTKSLEYIHGQTVSQIQLWKLYLTHGIMPIDYAKS